MKNKLALILLTSIIVTGCAAQGSSVGDLAVGDDSAAIKAGRNRASAQLSRAERTNVSEELALEREKRANKRDQINGAMGTAAGAVGLIGGIAGTAAAIKAWF